MELTLDQALQKGIEAHKAGKVEEADQYYTAILKANPKHPDANHNMGVLAVGVGKVEQALPFFKTALEVNQTIAQFWLSYIDALIKLDRIEDAKGVFAQSQSKGLQGEGFDQLDKRINATDTKKPNSQEPSQEQLQSLVSLYTQGQHQQSLTQASQLLKQFPNSLNLYNIIGASHKGLGELEKAVEAYTKAISLKPDHAETYNNMGNALREQEKLEEAKEAYKKALCIKPDYAEAHYNMGVTFKDQGKLEEAIQAYTKALSIKPDYAKAHYNMGVIFQDQGKLEAAIEAFEKSNDPVSVAQALECSYTLGNYDDFNLRLNSLAKRNPTNIRVAALSAFAANQRQSEDIYPFCKNPIELIKFSHIKNHVSDPDNFIAYILKEMNKKNSVWEPQNKTTKGGFQTNNKLFANSSTNMKTLEDIIKKELDLFRAEFNNNEDSLFQKWPDEMNINAWYVRMLKNGHQESHIHPGGWVSGVFYLKTVEAPIQNEGAIEFGLHGFDYPVISENYPKQLYQPRDGDLILFPSSLFHKTIPVIKDVERCVIAFDLVP